MIGSTGDTNPARLARITRFGYHDTYTYNSIAGSGIEEFGISCATSAGQCRYMYFRHNLTLSKGCFKKPGEEIFSSNRLTACHDCCPQRHKNSRIVRGWVGMCHITANGSPVSYLRVTDHASRFSKSITSVLYHIGRCNLTVGC